MPGSRRRSRLPPDWGRRRRLCFDTYGTTCWLQLDMCTQQATDIHHLGRHDDHSPDNLRPACAACHRHVTAVEANRIRRQQYPPKERPPERHPGEITEGGA